MCCADVVSLILMRKNAINVTIIEINRFPFATALPIGLVRETIAAKCRRLALHALEENVAFRELFAVVSQL